MIANEEVAQYITTQGTDEEGLGRWSWIRLEGAGAATRIITAYIPCTTRKKGYLRHNITTKKILETSR